LEPKAERRSAEGGAVEVRTLSARALLGAGRLLRIEHEGEIYTLRLTRNNKLILTK
jgi:hemin uptake protein HemP